MIDKARFISDLIQLAERDPPVRWLHQGREPETGLDCIGLPRYAYSLQERLPEALEREFDAYLTIPDGNRLLRVLREWFQEVDTAEKQPGDLILFYVRRNPQHMAVVINETEVVEAYRGWEVQRVIRWKIDPRRVVAGVFRITELR